MKAKDIMTARVITVSPDATTREIARILIAEGISAVPVVDESGAPLGIVSEGDLIGRDEEAREARHDWWLSLAAAEQAADLLAGLGNGRCVARDLMTAPVITVDEEIGASEIAKLLATYRIKRVPVLRRGRIVGIVSRADLLRVLAAETAVAAEPPQGLLGRAFAGLDGHFGLHRHGEAKPADAPAVTGRFSAEDFRQLGTDHEHLEAEHREEEHRARIAARDLQVSELVSLHLSDDAWRDLIAKAREAAEAGQKEFLLLRFPSQLCSDGGRAINAPEPGWPATLRGEAAEIYLRWERDLKPQGFHLAAQVLDFPGGFPGDIGLLLMWGG